MTKQLLCNSNCYIFEEFLAKLLCMIHGLSSVGDNLYICYNPCGMHDSNSCAFGGFCPHGKCLWLGIRKKHVHHCKIHCKFIIQMLSFAPILSPVNVRQQACPHLPDGVYKHCPACTDWEGEVHWTLNNIASSSMISEGLKNILCCSTFAGESSNIMKFSLQYWAQPSTTEGELTKCLDTTHLFCFTSFCFWWKSWKLMNMFSGKSTEKKSC